VFLMHYLTEVFMLKPYLELGQIVSTHGIKGEMRVNPWCDSPEFACVFKTVYLDDKGEKPVKVIASRPHGNIALMKLEGIDTVEQAAAMRNKIIYMARKDAKLPEGSWFIADLIGCKAVDADDENKIWGILTDVSQTGANDVWHITDESGKEYLLPVIPPVVISTDVENEKVYIRPLKGIFDDED